MKPETHERLSIFAAGTLITMFLCFGISMLQLPKEFRGGVYMKLDTYIASMNALKSSNAKLIKINENLSKEIDELRKAYIDEQGTLLKFVCPD